MTTPVLPPASYPGTLKVFTKICTKCGLELPMGLIHFYRQSKYSATGAAGWTSRCKSCTRDYARKYHHSTPRPNYAEITDKECSDCHLVQPITEFYGRKYRDKDGVERDRGWSTRCKECVRAKAHDQYHSKSKEWRSHQSSTKVRKQLVAERGECCQVCGVGERIVVDHNHKTGKPRGLLCGKHNSALGMFGDDVDTVISVLAYLLENSQ